MVVQYHYGSCIAYKLLMYQSTTQNNKQMVAVCMNKAKVHKNVDLHMKT